MLSRNPDWYGFPGAKESDIEKLVQEVDIDLPREYLALLRFSDGGETEVAIQPWNFVLDNVQTVLKFHSNEFFPGFFIFGGNGGGELFAIDKKLMTVVCLDSCNTDLSESRIHIADSFKDFLVLTHNGKSPGSAGETANV